MIDVVVSVRSDTVKISEVSKISRAIEGIFDDTQDNTRVLIRFLSSHDMDCIYDIGTESVPIDIGDDTFLVIAKKAHEKNITFNHEVANLVKDYIDSHPEGFPKEEIVNEVRHGDPTEDPA